MWNSKTVPAVAIVTTWADEERVTRPYADAATAATFVEWAASAGRDPSVSTTCPTHAAPIVQAVSYYGTWYGDCEACVADRAAAKARKY